MSRIRAKLEMAGAASGASVSCMPEFGFWSYYFYVPSGNGVVT